jgi:hypothetical protein
MLNKETLIANEALKDLTEEQIDAIVTLSENDEATVLGTKFGEVYRQMDSSIEKATGIKRIGDEKTYLYLERAAKEYADKFADYDALKTKITDLEAQIAKGGDDALKAELENVKKELSATKDQFNTLKASFDTEKANYAKALSDYKIESELARAREGIKLKAGFNEAVLNTLIAQATANIKAKNPSFEDKDGKERLIFHDENGAPLNNAENKLNPFTARELYIKEFEAMDILEKTPAKGAGGKQTVVTTGAHLGATTKEEATNIINKTLFDMGISKTDLRFQAEFDKLWNENDIDSLPLSK